MHFGLLLRAMDFVATVQKLSQLTRRQCVYVGTSLAQPNGSKTQRWELVVRGPFLNLGRLDVPSVRSTTVYQYSDLRNGKIQSSSSPRSVQKIVRALINS